MIVWTLFETVGVTVTGVDPTFAVDVPLFSVTTKPDGFDVTIREVAAVESGAAPPAAVHEITELLPVLPELPKPLLPLETAELPLPPPHAERPRIIASPAAIRGAPTKYFTLQSLP